MNRIAVKQVLVVLGCLASTPVSGEGELVSGFPPAVIPQPVAMKAGEGVFRLSSATQVVAVGQAKGDASKLADALAPAMGFRLEVIEAAASADGVVELGLDMALAEELGQEGYTLKATTKRIDVRAAGPAGLFFGIQTLRQLLPPSAFRRGPVADAEWLIPCVEITDFPRLRWRG